MIQKTLFVLTKQKIYKISKKSKKVKDHKTYTHQIIKYSIEILIISTFIYIFIRFMPIFTRFMVSKTATQHDCSKKSLKIKKYSKYSNIFI